MVKLEQIYISPTLQIVKLSYDDIVRTSAIFEDSNKLKDAQPDFFLEN